MQRRQLLVGIATSFPLTAGCLSLGEKSLIDPSNLSVYTNNKYSIKRPSGWSKEEKKAGVIAFSPSDSDMGTMTTQANKKPTSMSMDNYVNKFIGIYKESFKTFEISDKRTVQLPNDYSGTAIDYKGTGESKVQGQAVFANDGKNVYNAFVTVTRDAYTSTTKKGVSKIIKSLTIKQQ